MPGDRLQCCTIFRDDGRGNPLPNKEENVYMDFNEVIVVQPVKDSEGQFFCTRATLRCGNVYFIDLPWEKVVSMARGY
jgi:hypothetical protein